MKRKLKAGSPNRERSANPQLEAVLERIREDRHFDFRNYKRATLERRIERRLADRRCRTYAEYLALLDKDPGEFDALISAMLIKVTGFFRDPELWEALSKKIIPEILAEKREEIRVLRRDGGGLLHRGRWQIFGPQGDPSLRRLRGEQSGLRCADLAPRPAPVPERLHLPRRTAAEARADVLPLRSSPWRRPRAGGRAS